MTKANTRRRLPRGLSFGLRRLGAVGKTLYGGYAIAVALLCFVVTAIVLTVLPGQGRRQWFARLGVRCVFFFAGIPLRVDGLKHLPDGPCVVVANHRSYLDGAALIAALPGHFSPVIKAEVTHVPVLGTVLRRAGARFVRRAPAAQAGRDAAAMLEGLSRGESLALFPEGRVSLDAGLLPFREGAFFLAAKTGFPVVPVAIEGTQAVLPLGHMLPRFGTIHVEAAAPLVAAGQKRPQSRELRGRIETAYWRDLRPGASETRAAVEGYRHYLQVFRDCTPPFAYLDLDRLTQRLRWVLEHTRAKRLRVDARTLAVPAVIDRVLRSDIRLAGGCCASVAQAIHLARTWRLGNMVVTAPAAGSAELERVCDAIARGAKISLAVAASADVEAVAAAAQRRGLEVSVWVTLGTSIDAGGVSSAALADLLSVLDLIEHRAAVAFCGVIEAHRGSPSSDAARRAPEQARAVVRAQLTQRGYGHARYSIRDSADLAADADDFAVTELVVGRELFAVEAGDAPAWPVAGYVLDRPDDATGAPVADEPGHAVPIAACREANEAADDSACRHLYFFAAPDTAALDARFTRLYLVQGGAVVGGIATSKAVGPNSAHPPNRRRRRARRGLSRRHP